MGHSIGVLLFAVIGGYWLLERGLTHKGQMKQLGLILGSVIIVISLVGVVAQAWSLGTCRGSHGGMMGKKAGWCPMMPSSDQAPSPTK